MSGTNRWIAFYTSDPAIPSPEIAPNLLIRNRAPDAYCFDLHWQCLHFSRMCQKSLLAFTALIHPEYLYHFLCLTLTAADDYTYVIYALLYHGHITFDTEIIGPDVGTSIVKPLLQYLIEQQLTTRKIHALAHRYPPQRPEVKALLLTLGEVDADEILQRWFATWPFTEMQLTWIILNLPQKTCRVNHNDPQRMQQLALADGRYQNSWDNLWIMEFRTSSFYYLSALIRLRQLGAITFDVQRCERDINDLDLWIDPVQQCIEEDNVPKLLYVLARLPELTLDNIRVDTIAPDQQVVKVVANYHTDPSRFMTQLRCRYYGLSQPMIPADPEYLHVLLYQPSHDHVVNDETPSIFLQIYYAVPPELQQLICMMYGGVVNDFIPAKCLGAAFTWMDRGCYPLLARDGEPEEPF